MPPSRRWAATLPAFVVRLDQVLLWMRRRVECGRLWTGLAQVLVDTLICGVCLVWKDVDVIAVARQGEAPLKQVAIFSGKQANLLPLLPDRVEFSHQIRRTFWSDKPITRRLRHNARTKHSKIVTSQDPQPPMKSLEQSISPWARLSSTPQYKPPPELQCERKRLDHAYFRRWCGRPRQWPVSPPIKIAIANVKTTWIGFRPVGAMSTRGSTRR